MQQICGLIVDFANELPFWGWIGGVSENSRWRGCECGRNLDKNATFEIPGSSFANFFIWQILISFMKDLWVGPLKPFWLA